MLYYRIQQLKKTGEIHISMGMGYRYKSPQPQTVQDALWWVVGMAIENPGEDTTVQIIHRDGSRERLELCEYSRREVERALAEGRDPKTAFIDRYAAESLENVADYEVLRGHYLALPEQVRTTFESQRD